jgi:SAM-dependent methyltransferase
MGMITQISAVGRIYGRWKTRPKAAQHPIPPNTTEDLKATYVSWTEHWKSHLPRAEAMESAIGGDFERIGRIEAALVRHYGLGPDGHLIDVGCGSGRLAKPLSEYLAGSYLGFDLVPDLIAYARQIVDRPDWRFETIDHIGIPESDGRADMVCFFSVLTHLLHEQSYWYLQEARRVLKPGGKILFSFLEYREPAHWNIFMQTLDAAKQMAHNPLNVFIERDAIPIWASHLDLVVEDIRDAADAIVAEGHLGQSVCVMRKPA